MTENKTFSSKAIDLQKEVSGPSIGLLITGIIGVILSGVGLIATIIGTSIIPFVEGDFPDRYEQFFQGALGVASSFMGILVAAFIIYASLKMKELKQWGLGVAASILAMVPCISPCCIIGLPVGIWCLVVLMKPEVRAAFH